ncbi:hypothetical protein SLEP1_g58574 [Rubroshorea leprosula]|uniref:Integrase catalytic domain-containing protein n=1 Tax=Rubroshorea leprosula TaxID=152421 RepID=A0AAV5MPU4_9ROSI|nr:hypothetical protein SLEP1_g58574 [Rubroshorea leprosula]
MVKPSLRSPSKWWKRVVHPKFPKGQNPRTLRRCLQRKKAAKRHQQQITDSGGMAEQARPLPVRRKSVWVRKEKWSTSGQNSPEKEKPPKSPMSPRVLVVESNEETGLKAKFDMLDKVKNSSDIICFDLTEEEEVIEIPAKEDGGMDSADKIIFEKPEERMAKHIRPLYIHAHLDGMPINRVLVDNGAAINVLPTCILHKIGKSLGDLMETEVTISDFTGGVNCSRRVLPVELTWKLVIMMKILGLSVSLGWIAMTDILELLLAPDLQDRIKHQKKEVVEEIKRKLATYLAEKRICIDRFEVIYEGEEDNSKDQITLEELDLAPAKLDDLKAEVQDPLEEVNLCTEVDSKITFISDSLEPCLCDKIISILHEYKDCFAWDYSEMPSLDRNLVEHRLPIKEDFKPFKQPPRRMSPKVTLKVKEEIERLLKVGSIKTSRYVEWLSNVIPVVKKNGKLRICVDFRNLNLATPKDEYPMPIADLLVNGYLVHERGLEVDQNKARAVIEVQLPRSEKELQRFLGQLLEEFDDVILRHVTQDLNTEANEMVEIASGLKILEGVMSRIVVVEKRILPSIHMRGMAISACSIDVTQIDWRYPIMEYLKNPKFKASRITKMQALNCVLLEDVLYRRGHDELLLRCLGPDEYCQIMSDVHNRIYGAHQAGIKMRWLIRRHGFFWPLILKDCISYAKDCKACQIHGPLQKVPASELHPIIKSWPFRGWAIDLIGKVYPPSTRWHSFIIVATDYFTKWVKAKPMKKVDQTDIIKFLKEEIIHKFGLPKIVTLDQGTVFVGAQVEAFAKEMGFRLLTSTPHYAQANGQAEASNRIVINLLEKMVDDNPRRWHELLSNTIWAYRTSQRSSTKVTPFSLTYGHDVVLPMELSTRSLRIAIQHGLTFGKYNEAMILELEDLEGDLVWKVILPPGKKDPRFGKWSPNWEGPFRIHEVLKGGAYWLESLNGELHPRRINGIYLKPYYPMIWEARGSDIIGST